MAAETAVGPTPASKARRSFVYRILEESDATFVEVGDSLVAATVGGDATDEGAQARELGLIDLSPLPRTGFKGRSALDWLRGQGIDIGDEDNRAYPIDGGALALRLAPSEVLILGDLGATGDTCARLDGAWSMETADGAYLVPRRGASFWFVVSGRHAPSMFAKVCGVDLRPDKFADLAIAQTSVARTNAIIVRNDRDDLPLFHVLGDSASAEYFWSCLLDAMDEFHGRPAGYLALGIKKDT